MYIGKRKVEGVGGQVIMISENGEERPLPHILRHSPDGFQWGYGGSGPADAALSILTDCLGEDQANKLYQNFKWDFVASWKDDFQISEKEIKEWSVQFVGKK